MKKLFLLPILLILGLCSFGQSETHDFTTYDTLWTEAGGAKWAVRISRPVNMFTPNHPDTASRPVIIMMPGAGEAVDNIAQQQANTRVYGPHYWLDHGWDGGVQLANGKHYPILITVVPSYQNPRAPAFYALINFLINTYHIKKNSVHGTGLSMGGFTWSKSMVYEASAGAETFMKMVKSICMLQGTSNETFAPYNAWSLGWGAFGHWAKKYGGRYFGLEGTNDSRNMYTPRNNIRDTLAAYGDTNTAYFAFENIGAEGGAKNHCCWNDMYDPSRTNWQGYPRTDMGPNIAWNTNAGKDNTNGTYQKGWNLFQWMIRQGDTTLVTGVPGAPIANAGPDQNITATSTTLNSSSSSGTITSRTWSRISGPNTPTITTPTTTSTTVTGLVNGTYVFQISVTDGTNTSTDQVTVVKTDPANTPPTVNAGLDRTINLPKDSVHLDASASDPDGSISSQTWSQISGPNSAVFSSASSSTAAVTGLMVGTYTFRLTVTDNSAATVTDEITVIVIDPSQQVAKRIYWKVYYPNWAPAYQPDIWNNFNTNGNTSFSSILKYEDNTTSNYTINLANFHQLSNNGISYTGFTMCPDAVGQITSYLAAGATRNITFSGLNPTITYNLQFYSSRLNATTNSTRFTINGVVVTIASGNNKSDAAIFTDVTPNLDGTIVAQVTGLATSYVNGGLLEESGASETVNQPPVVQPIANQTITLPTSSVNLSASVSDVDDVSLTYQWLKLAGSPAGGTFSDDDGLTTTFSSLTQGVYNLQFSATDEHGNTTSRTFTVTVNAAGNQAPVVNAGSDQNLAIIPPATFTSATITGTATDPDGTIVSRLWTKKSGPASGTIQNTNQNSTLVTNLVEGSYTFTFTATDNNGTSTSDDIIVNVSLGFVDNLPKYIVGLGEYQVYFIDPSRNLWGMGNLSNIGNGNTGQAGITYRATGDAFNTKFKFTDGGLHGGIAIDVDGNVWVSGDNDQYQHGQGDALTNIYVFRKILIDSLGNPFTGIKMVQGAYNLTSGIQANAFYAVKEDGTLWVWGKTGAGSGFRGNGTDSVVTYNTRPVQVVLPGDRRVKQMSMGINAMVLATDGTVWVWGKTSNANLGYTPATTKDYQTPHQLTTLPEIAQISGTAGKSYALSTSGVLYGWGSSGNYMGDLVFPTGNGTSYPTPRALTNIMNALPASPIKKLVSNYPTTTVLLENGELWSWGATDQAGVGNGQTTDWPNYPTPYAWDGVNRLFVKLPVRIAPGILFKEVWGSNVYTYYTYALDENDNLYCWGRGKASVLANGIYGPTGALVEDKQNAWDIKWPHKVVFPVTSSYPATSPDCVDGTSTGSPCNTYSIPANTKPTANAGSTQNITTNHTTLTSALSTDNVYIGWREWKQVSGPSTAVISLPGCIETPISGLVDGIYVFRVVVEDNGRLKDSATVTVNVNQIGNIPPVINPIPNPSVQLPAASVTLTAVASDADGSISSYLWTKVSGPAGGNIATPNAATTLITSLSPGTYIFQVKVTDNVGQETTRQVSVIVTAVQDGRKKYFQIRVIKNQ